MTRSRVVSFFTGDRMTDNAQECIQKLSNRTGDRAGMLWTWIRQGKLQSKDFKNVFEHIVNREVVQKAAMMQVPSTSDSTDIIDMTGGGGSYESERHEQSA